MMKYESGTSLLELLLTVVIVASLVFLLANLPNAFLLINKSKHLSLAREIAVKQIEDKRAVSFVNLVNDSSSINDYRMNLLPNASGTVTVEDCDPSICTNGELIKMVSVVLNWTESKPQEITLNTLIGEGGIN